MDWNQEARGLLRAEMARRKISYKILANRLEKIGVQESVKGIANKIGRGTFSFAFFLQCMKALEIQHVELR